MTAISVLPGDGIGPEVVDEALHTLDALDVDLSIDVLDHVNAGRFRDTGDTLTDDDLARIGHTSAMLLGAVGVPDVDSAYARGIVLRLRREYDLYANMRPARLLHDDLSPLRDGRRRRIDCLVVRENTEGLYSGLGGTIHATGEQAVALDTEISTFYGVSRIVDAAFGRARDRVCLVDKANAVPAGGTLWQRCFREVAARYPNVDTDHEFVDAAAMKLVTDPERFDVIVANNSHGDILSDVAAAVAGGIGCAASANIGTAGFALFEPVHGSAPDIAGCGVANPFGVLMSLTLLLDQLASEASRRDHGCTHKVSAANPDDLRQAADAVRAAVRSALDRGWTTPDLGGQLDTKGVGAAVRSLL